VVLVAADQPLFRQVDFDVVVDEDSALHGSDGAERPAAAAPSLVLDGGDAVVFSPVPLRWQRFCGDAGVERGVDPPVVRDDEPAQRPEGFFGGGSRSDGEGPVFRSRLILHRGKFRL